MQPHLSRLLQGAPLAAPLLDLVPSQSTADRAFGLIKLRSGHKRPCGEARNLQGGSYVNQEIGYIRVGRDEVFNRYAAAAFAALADPGTYTEVRFYDNTPNEGDAAFSGSHLGFFWAINPYGDPVLSVTPLYSETAATGHALTTTTALNLDAHTQIFVGEFNSSCPLTATTITELINNVAARSPWFIRSPTNQGHAHVYGGFATNRNFGLLRSGPTMLMLVSGASTISLTCDSEAPVSIAKGTAGYNSVSAWLGWSANGSGSRGGVDYRCMIFYNRALNAAEQALVQQWSYRLNPGAADTVDTLQALGDSQTEGRHLPSNAVWHKVMRPLLTRRFNVTADGVSGTSYSQHEAVVARTLARLGTGTNVVFLMSMSGTEMLDGATPAQTLAAMKSLCTALRSGAASAGKTVKIVGIAQARFDTGSLSQANQDGFHDLLVADNAHLDAFWNIWADPVLGEAANLSDTSYYYTDNQHWAVGGHARVAVQAAALVNAVL